MPVACRLRVLVVVEVVGAAGSGIGYSSSSSSEIGVSPDTVRSEKHFRQVYILYIYILYVSNHTLYVGDDKCVQTLERGHAILQNTF